MSNGQLKARLYLVCVIVLAAGLCGSVLIYQLADDDPLGASNYIIVEGIAYPVPVQLTKRYIRDLERFGGKSAVLFDEFNRWFDALWRGKSLGITLGWLSVIISLGIFLFARWLPSDN